MDEKDRFKFYRKYQQTDFQKEESVKRVRKFREENPGKVIEYNAKNATAMKNKRKELRESGNKRDFENHLKNERSRIQTFRSNMTSEEKTKRRKKNSEHKAKLRENNPKQMLKRMTKYLTQHCSFLWCHFKGKLEIIDGDSHLSSEVADN